MQTLDAIRDDRKSTRPNYFCQDHQNDAAGSPALPRIACLANVLAKQLKGHQGQRLAYRIKTEICEMLIICGTASANNVAPNGTVGLTIAIDGHRPIRIHILRVHLCQEARTIIDEQTRTLHVVAPLQDFLKAATQ